MRSVGFRASVFFIVLCLLSVFTGEAVCIFTGQWDLKDIAMSQLDGDADGNGIPEDQTPSAQPTFTGLSDVILVAALPSLFLRRHARFGSIKKLGLMADGYFSVLRRPPRLS